MIAFLVEVDRMSMSVRGIYYKGIQDFWRVALRDASLAAQLVHKSKDLTAVRQAAVIPPASACWTMLVEADGLRCTAIALTKCVAARANQSHGLRLRRPSPIFAPPLA
jgi:hypothetical protein